MELDEKKCPQCAETVKAEAVVCRYCSYRFDGSAGAVSQPTTVKKRSKFKTVGCLGSVAVFLVVVSCMSQLTTPGSKLASSPLGVDTQVQNIKDKVAADAVKQYQIAAESGTAMDRCVQAGLVAAAFLQAQSQTDYSVWKATEKSDCSAVGLSR